LAAERFQPLLQALATVRRAPGAVEEGQVIAQAGLELGCEREAIRCGRSHRIASCNAC
jgi:hypothetical protein